MLKWRTHLLADSFRRRLRKYGPIPWAVLMWAAYAVVVVTLIVLITVGVISKHL